MPRREKCLQRETLALCRPTLQDSICNLTWKMKSLTQLKNRLMLLFRPRNKPKKDFKKVASKTKIKTQAANQTRKIKDLSSRPCHKWTRDKTSTRIWNLWLLHWVKPRSSSQITSKVSKQVVLSNKKFSSHLDKSKTSASSHQTLLTTWTLAKVAVTLFSNQKVKVG